jgi:hypothetical protein
MEAAKARDIVLSRELSTPGRRQQGSSEKNEESQSAQ